MKNALLILSLLFAGQATAADISLTGPDGPIQPATYVILGVTGVPDTELPKAVVQVSPADGTTILPAKTWGGSPIVIFSAAKPGKYTVTVHVGNSQSGNDSFRRPLEDGAKQAELARIDGALLSDLKGTVGRIAERYPLSGRLVIEVIGARPPPVDPDDPPQPPVPVTRGVCWVVIIRQTDTMTAEQGAVVSDLRQWTDQQPRDKVAHWEFPPDAVGPDGQRDPKVASYVKQIPADKKDPYVFICQADASGKSVVIWHGELPATAQSIIDRIKGATQ